MYWKEISVYSSAKNDYVLFSIPIFSLFYTQSTYITISRVFL
jgi:hypothetical protein